MQPLFFACRNNILQRVKMHIDKKMPHLTVRHFIDQSIASDRLLSGIYLMKNRLLLSGFHCFLSGLFRHFLTLLHKVLANRGDFFRVSFHTLH